MLTQKYYSPHYGDPPKGTPNFGNLPNLHGKPCFDRLPRDAPGEGMYGEEAYYESCSV